MVTRSVKTTIQWKIQETSSILSIIDAYWIQPRAYFISSYNSPEHMPSSWYKILKTYLHVNQKKQQPSMKPD